MQYSSMITRHFTEIGTDKQKESGEPMDTRNRKTNLSRAVLALSFSMPVARMEPGQMIVQCLAFNRGGHVKLTEVRAVEENSEITGKTTSVEADIPAGTMEQLLAELNDFAVDNPWSHPSKKDPVSGITPKYLLALYNGDEPPFTVANPMAGEVPFMDTKTDHRIREWLPFNFLPVLGDQPGRAVVPIQGELEEKLEKRRVELSMLILERDHLRASVCANLEMQYLLLFGQMEYDIYKLIVEYRRLRRKKQLLQAAVNRQEPIHEDQIERVLDEEMAIYREAMKEKQQKLDWAMMREKSAFLSAEDARELKKKYRAIVKVLHPDINPDVEKWQIKLFQEAVEDYKNGNLAHIREIYLLVETMAPPEGMDDERSRETLLQERLNQIESRLEAVRYDIGKIKNSWPYTLKDVIGNEEWQETKQKELEEERNRMRAVRDAMQKAVEALIRKHEGSRKHERRTDQN